MPMYPTACIVIVCAQCGLTPWDEHPTTPHFRSLAEAKPHLGDWRWEGDVPLLCPPCAAEEDCATYGHDWSDWQDCRCGGQIRTHRDGCPQVRWCHRCLAADYAYPTAAATTGRSAA